MQSFFLKKKEQHIGDNLSDESVESAIRRGILAANWPGRFEVLSDSPYLIIDGAHNEDGVRAFLEAVASDGHEGNRSLLFSVVKDKDLTEDDMINLYMKAQGAEEKWQNAKIIAKIYFPHFTPDNN